MTTTETLGTILRDSNTTADVAAAILTLNSAEVLSTVAALAEVFSAGDADALFAAIGECLTATAAKADRCKTFSRRWSQHIANVANYREALLHLYQRGEQAA